MGDSDPFGEWFRGWLGHRSEVGPVGWYKSADLKAAFNAGMGAERARGLREIIARTKALEDTLRAGNPYLGE